MPALDAPLRASLSALMLTVFGLAGCGGAPPPPPARAAAAPPPAAAPAPPPPAAKSEIGGLNEADIERAFHKLSGDIEGCFATGSARVAALGGRFKMKLRIDGEGALRWAYLAESTLGDRDTEKCLLDAAHAKTWPRPVGGEGLAEKSFEIESPQAPTPLDEERFKAAIKLARKETAKCRKAGAWGVFQATTYLRGDGRVLAAGISPPNEKGEAVVDCMAKALKKLRFGSVGRRTGKLSFELR
ncbi:hypothetical protein [Polyangium aurulentum]|uniref:hypothetical protein n=1 Tax=Polyangium aurulentum TaxID=2567896 RepID=UPI00146F4E7A|nr:hypothetical protein [Polyangium aurulentum]UQA56183.1 hypothetical protein E8A73_033430 [Polyangium aurulentum]